MRLRLLLLSVLLSLLLWTLMVERFLYLFFAHNKVQDAALRLWQQRTDKCSWWALKIRECLLSEQQAKLFARLATIKMLIALCPLMGLLGTVTGMISVFDTIAITGSSDAKAMADGIYRATLPTMAGLMLALSAMYFSHHLQQKAQRMHAFFADLLIAGAPNSDGAESL